MKKLVIILVLFSTSAFAQFHSREFWQQLSHNCSIASDLIRKNQCEPVKGGCDCALKKTLELGCRIQWWGHYPKCP
jgi:hypothetical protein